MMSNERAVQKARALNKYREEYTVRSGGTTTRNFALGGALIGFLVQPFLFRNPAVPYRFIVGSAFFWAFTGAGQWLFGDPSH